MTSLTSAAARERACSISVVSYDVALDLTMGDRNFGSVTSVRFTAADGGTSTFADVAPSQLRSVQLNGEPLDVAAAFDPATKRLTLHPRPGDNELVVDAVMAYSHDGEGLHRHVDPADGRPYLYAMSFLAAAPRWYACFDQPDLKAPTRLDVRCATDWLVRGNGPATEIEPGHWSIAATGPLATYFTTLVAGPYHSVEDSHDGIALSLLARRSLAEHLEREAPELFAHTKASFDGLHDLFGVRYPWGEYHQAFVPDFNAGAMENPGCVTYRDTLVFRARPTDSERLDRKTTMSHEMAHMWFGDLVTMRWWDDLWLNESFAEYLGCRVTGEQTWVDFGISRKAWGFAADRRRSTHPVAGNGAVDAEAALSDFDGISYAKGASVLRQLAAHLGDDLYLEGLRRYISTHATGNAEFADLIAAWTAAGAGELDGWMQAWLRTTGMDSLSVADGAVLRHSSSGTPRPHAVSVAALGSDGARTASQRLRVLGDRTPLEFDAAAAVSAGGVVVPDAADETWAKVVLSDAEWQRMAGVLGRIADPHTRVAIWNALQLAVSDAEVPPALAVDVVVAALPAEADDAVISQVSRWAIRRLAGCYLTDATRGAALARIADAMLTVTIEAAAGSGRQLAAGRAWIAATTESARLRAWLSDQQLPDGLLVDTELRWAVLRRLALLGKLDDAAIAEEAARDRSSQGAVHATRCRAALPDPQAKQAAWDTMMHDPERPNYELYALAEGFWDPDQRDLTDRYVGRYFEEIPATAALRSGWVVARLAELAYPWTAVEPATVAATERLLADDRLDSGIRRSVSDAGDDLRSAVAVRDRFVP